MLLGGVAAAGAASYAVKALAVGLPLPCVDGTAQQAAMGCGVALVLTGLLTFLRPFVDAPRLVLTWLLLTAISLWLGAYRLSPLGFGAGNTPLLQGFRVQRVGRTPILAASRATLSISRGATVEIEPQILPQTQPSCRWISEASAAIDDPLNCDIAYQAPSRVEYDVLRVRVHSDCSLPDAVADLRFSVLP
jgi:hypothetical protein